jgi:hypothetical protein
MDIQQKLRFASHRRTFLEKSSTGMGAFALASLLGGMPSASANELTVPGAMKQLHFAPKAIDWVVVFKSLAVNCLVINLLFISLAFLTHLHLVRISTRMVLMRTK